MKSKLNKCDDEYLALLNYRDTPLPNGYSPAQLSMGRKLKTRIPCNTDELLSRLPDYERVRRKEEKYRQKMADDYNRKHRVVEGEQLSPGDRVWIPDLHTEGSVMKHHEAPRSVVIQTPRSTIRRNRRMTLRLEDHTTTQLTGRGSEPLHPDSTTVPVVPTTPPESLPKAAPLAIPPAAVPDRPLETPTPVEPRWSERLRRPPRRYVEEY